MKYSSRKFMITSGGMLLAVACAYIGILTPQLANVFLAGIAAYNLANAYVGKSE